MYMHIYIYIHIRNQLDKNNWCVLKWGIDPVKEMVHLLGNMMIKHSIYIGFFSRRRPRDGYRMIIEGSISKKLSICVARRTFPKS